MALLIFSLLLASVSLFLLHLAHRLWSELSAIRHFIVFTFVLHGRRRGRPPRNGHLATIRRCRRIGGRRYRNCDSTSHDNLPITTVLHAGEQRYSSKRFVGAVLDGGAAKSCIGLSQARAYARYAGIRLQFRRPQFRFAFGDNVEKALGIMDIPVTTPGGIWMIPTHVVSSAVPFLIGADALDSHHVFVRNTRDVLQAESPADWSMPFIRAYGHYILPPAVFWGNLTIPVKVKAAMNVQAQVLSKRDIYKLHRVFRHPSATKLFHLMQSTTQKDLPPSLMKVVQDVVNSCQTCNRIRKRQIVFTQRLKGEIVFNRKLLLDLVYLEGKAVLHIVDQDTGFGAARFIKSVSAAAVWETFVLAWASVYVGVPDVVQHDRGSNFASKELQFLFAASGVETKVTGVEAHHSLGQLESAHHPLRTVYLRLRKDHPGLNKDVVLQLSRKALNDVGGVKGFPPTLLAFGSYPRSKASGLDFALPKNEHRLAAMKSARKNARIIINQQRVQRILRQNLAPSVDVFPRPGERFYAFRDDEKYQGPFDVLAVSKDKTQLFLADRETAEGQWYSLDRCRPEPEECDIFTAELALMLEGSLSAKAQHARKLREQRRNNAPNCVSAHMTELLTARDPRLKCPEAAEAKLRELRGLIGRGTFKIVLREEMQGKKPLRGRVVMVIKDKGGEERFKARFVIQGFRDPDKKSMLHPATNITIPKMRLLFALASIFGFRVWTTDVTMAFLQSATKGMRKIFVEGLPEMELDANEVLELLRPLYGLADSGDRWHATLQHHHVADLQMEALDSEPAFYFRCMGERLIGLSGLYVDDILRAGTKEYEQLSASTSQKFDTTPSVFDEDTFAGLHFKEVDNGIAVDMQEYITKLRFKEGQDYTSFASNRAKLAWLVYARPDICAVIAKVAQITNRMYQKDPAFFTDVLQKILRRVQTTPLTLFYPRLDKDTVFVRCYADASFATNEDGSSQLGHIIVLMDASNRFSIIKFRSGKSYRVAHSAMAAEAFSLSEAFDAGFVVKTELERLLKRPVALQLLTDSKQCFDTISFSSRTKEQRLQLDLAAARQGFNKREITDLGLVESRFQLADAFTKVMPPTQLMAALGSGKLEHPISKFVVRDHTD